MLCKHRGGSNPLIDEPTTKKQSKIFPLQNISCNAYTLREIFPLKQREDILTFNVQRAVVKGEHKRASHMEVKKNISIAQR